MRIEVKRDQADPGYKALAGIFYKRWKKVTSELAALSIAHNMELEKSLKRAQEIARLTSQLKQLQLPEPPDNHAEVDPEDELDGIEDDELETAEA